MEQLSARSNLTLRIMSALVLAPMILLIVWAGGIVYTLLLSVVLCLLAMEWQKMSDALAKPPWLWSAVVYLLSAVMSLWYLRQLTDGLTVMIWLLAVVWTTDSMAYFVGKAVGGAKLAPSISPKKTWSGFMGGVVGSVIVGLLTALMVSSPDVFFVAAFSGAVSIASQIGDLIESKVKRLCDVKDSSHIIPGHGGVFDRVDGLLLAAILVAATVWMLGRGPFLWF